MIKTRTKVSVLRRSPPMTWLLKGLDRAVYPLLLVLAGLGGFYVEIVERFFPGHKFSEEHERALTLTLVGLIAIALGIER
jgi:hypothetical protein